MLDDSYGALIIFQRTRSALFDSRLAGHAVTNDMNPVAALQQIEARLRSIASAHRKDIVSERAPRTTTTCRQIHSARAHVLYICAC